MRNSFCLHWFSPSIGEVLVTLYQHVDDGFSKSERATLFMLFLDCFCVGVLMEEKFKCWRPLVAVGPIATNLSFFVSRRFFGVSQ